MNTSSIVVPLAKAPETSSAPAPSKVKVKAGPTEKDKLVSEPIVGFVTNPELASRVPDVGPNGLPMIEGKEIKFIMRECDVDMWYRLRRFKKCIAMGTAGTGKDISLIAFAAKHRLAHKVFPFCGSARVEDLYGHRDLQASNGATISPWVMHDDLKCLVHGGLLVLSEFNAGATNELIALNDAFEARKATVQRTGSSYTFHEHAYLALNFNPGFGGTKSLNDATKTRFPIVPFPAWTKDELYRLLGPIKNFDKLAELYVSVQRAMEDPQHGLKGGVMSLRNILRIDKCIEDGETVDKALHCEFLDAFICDTMDRTNYNAALLLTTHLFGTEVKSQSKYLGVTKK